MAVMRGRSKEMVHREIRKKIQEVEAWDCISGHQAQLILQQNRLLQLQNPVYTVHICIFRVMMEEILRQSVSHFPMIRRIQHRPEMLLWLDGKYGSSQKQKESPLPLEIN